MRVLACYQIVPDLSTAYENDWTHIAASPASGAFARVFDCFDEAALEMALTLRDEIAAAGEEAELCALTLAATGDDRASVKLFALGFERLVRIDMDTGYLCTPEVKAAAIARSIESIGVPDILFFGIRSGIGGSGMTGPMIAERLGLPCVSNVCDVGRGANGKLRVAILEGGKRTIGEIPVGAALLVGNSDRGLLRIPTLKAMRGAKGKNAEVVAPHGDDIPPGVAFSDDIAPLVTLGNNAAPLVTLGNNPVDVTRPPAACMCRDIEGDIEEKARTVAEILRNYVPKQMREQ